MSNEDETTLKIRPYSGTAEPVAPRDNLTQEQHNALELVKKSAQLEEERKKSLGYLQTIDQLQAGLRQEQAKTAEMTAKIAALEARLKELPALEAKARKSAELESRIGELTGALGRISAIAAAGKAD